MSMNTGLIERALVAYGAELVDVYCRGWIGLPGPRGRLPHAAVVARLQAVIAVADLLGLDTLHVLLEIMPEHARPMFEGVDFYVDISHTCANMRNKMASMGSFRSSARRVWHIARRFFWA